MSNSLIKNKLTVRTFGTEEVPAQPYFPGSPERVVYTSQQYCQWVESGGYGPGQGPGYWVIGTTSYTSQWVSTAPVSGPSSSRVWACATVLVPVIIPAAPPRPAIPGTTRTTSTSQTTFNLGWNGGARSIKIFTANAGVDFHVRRSVVGAIVGMNLYDGVPSDYSGNTIDYAFYLARGQARLMRNGIPGLYVGEYTDATKFTIERTGTAISYKMDDAEVGTATGAPTTSGWLEAALYSADDEVFDPAVRQISAADLTAQTGVITASFSALTVLASEGAYTEISASFEPMIALMSAGALVPPFAVMDAVFAPLSMTLDGLTGEIGAVAASFEPMQVLAADHAYGELIAAFAPMQGALSALEGNENATLHSSADAAADLSSASLLFVTMTSTGEIADAWIESVLLTAELMASASLAGTFGTNALVDAVLASVATSGAVLGVSTGGPGGTDDGSQTWVVNLDSTGSTTYTNYGFNSFAHIDGRDYGANETGIYALEGDTDVGMPIRARMSLGKLDFDSSQRKVISEAFVGISALGNIFIKVIANGEAYVYQTQRSDVNLQQQRVKFGRGLNANYLELEIYNEEGADFEIDTVEFLVADLNRKT